MKVTDRPILTENDQRLLDGVTVRLLAPEERERFDQLLLTQHYLKSAALVGEQLRYVFSLVTARYSSALSTS